MGPTEIVRIQAHAAGEEVTAAFASPIKLPDVAAGDPLPKDLVWMPAGNWEISAGNKDGGVYYGNAICDEQACRVVAADLKARQQKGVRAWLDLNHDGGAASADVRAFVWDPARGIVAQVDWTPRGERALRDKEFSTFSPEFGVNKSTGRILGLTDDGSLGGLVNMPAFKAMPSLIAARLHGGANQNKPASDGNSDTRTMKDLLIKILAALKVTPPADATEDQLVALVAKSMPADSSAEVVALKKQLDDAEKASVHARKENADKIAALEKKQSENEAVVAGIQAKRTEVSVGVSLDDAIAAYAAKDPGQLPANERNSVDRAELALERANIFASEISPRLKKATTREERRGILHGIVLHAREKADSISKVVARMSNNRVQVTAANSLGTLSGSLIAQNALSLLKPDLPALSSFTTDFSNAAAKLNQTVITRVRALQSEQTYSTSTGYAAADMTDTDVSVVINAHKYAQFAYNANELASTNRDLFGEQAEGAVFAIGKGTVDAALALFTLANYSIVAQKSIVALGAWNRAALIAQRVALRKRYNMIKDGFCVMNEDYFGALASDASVVSLATYQRPELINEYMLPKIAGFNPVGYVDLPTTNNLTAILGDKGAACIATRLPYDYVDAQIGSNYGSVSQITDPSSGLSVMLTQYVNHDLGVSNYRVAIMRGVSVGDKTRAQLVVSA